MLNAALFPLQKMFETKLGKWVQTKLNCYCDYFSPPNYDNPTPKNVLIIHAHPSHASLSGALLNATKKG